MYNVILKQKHFLDRYLVYELGGEKGWGWSTSYSVSTIAALTKIEADEFVKVCWRGVHPNDISNVEILIVNAKNYRRKVRKSVGVDELANI